MAQKINRMKTDKVRKALVRLARAGQGESRYAAHLRAELSQRDRAAKVAAAR